MKAIRPLLYLLVAQTIATGCAHRSLSAHQCAAGDWQTVGYSDGARGLSQAQVLQHQNACGRHAIVPDTNSYRIGWTQGIREFCVADRGYDLGRAGSQFPAVCPADLNGAFRAAFDDGKVLFLAERDVARLDAQLARTERRIDEIGTALINTGSAQLTPGLTTQDRLDLLAESKALIDERDRLTKSLPELAVALDRAHQRLDEVRLDLARN